MLRRSDLHEGCGSGTFVQADCVRMFEITPRSLSITAHVQ
jgi:hypothetical protein